MYEQSDESRDLMIAATQHRIAGDFLMAGSIRDNKLPVRAVIYEQYSISMRRALESFLANQETEVGQSHCKKTLHKLFVYCENHGLDLQDTPDFSKENFEMLLAAYDENIVYKSGRWNANYTADLIWPQLYAGHLIEKIQAMISGIPSFSLPAV